LGRRFFEVAKGDGRGEFHPPLADEIWGGVPFCRFTFQNPKGIPLPLSREIPFFQKGMF
jgi:hypothetical protein